MFDRTTKRSKFRFDVRVCAGAALAAVVLASGCSSGAGGDRPAAFRGTLLDEPIEKVDFTLLDTDSRPFAFQAETEGYLTLLFFGYTNCPDVCPVHMASLGSILERFPWEVRSRVKVVFVTTDPDRDTPERIREWLDRFGRGFIGLRGSLEEVNRIQARFGLAAAGPGPTDDRGGYVVGHAAQILAFTPDGRAHVAYPFGTRQEDWLHDIPVLLAREW